MDSKDVNTAIRAVVRPFLKEQGFARFTARWGWRHREHQIDCIHFWSPYNWVEAEIKGITTFSFQIGMGIYFVDIPPEGPGPDEKSGRLLPKDYQCHIRRGLQKPADYPKPSMPLLWYIDPDGVNLEEVINSVRYALERDALPWFDRFGDRESFLELLLADGEQVDEVGWGFGAPGSQSRNYMLGYLAKSLGHSEMAIAALEAYLESAKEHSKLGLGAYALIFERVASDIAVMRLQLGDG